MWPIETLGGKLMFKPDGPFFNVLARIMDLIILNVLWMVCCLGIITIGPATTALYSVLFKIREKKDYSVTAQFFLEFKNNFRHALPGAIALVLAAFLLYIDFRVVFYDKTFTLSFMSSLFWVVLVIAFAYFSWLFPLIAKFENTAKGHFHNARLMMLRHLPMTVIITVLNLLPWLLAYFQPVLTLQNMLLFWLFIGFALIAYVNALLLYRCFYQYFDQSYIDQLNKAKDEISS